MKTKSEAFFKCSRVKFKAPSVSVNVLVPTANHEDRRDFIIDICKELEKTVRKTFSKMRPELKMLVVCNTDFYNYSDGGTETSMYGGTVSAGEGWVYYILRYVLFIRDQNGKIETHIYEEYSEDYSKEELRRTPYYRLCKDKMLRKIKEVYQEVDKRTAKMTNDDVCIINDAVNSYLKSPSRKARIRKGIKEIAKKYADLEEQKDVLKKRIAEKELSINKLQQDIDKIQNEKSAIKRKIIELIEQQSDAKKHSERLEELLG